MAKSLYTNRSRLEIVILTSTDPRQPAGVSTDVKKLRPQFHSQISVTKISTSIAHGIAAFFSLLLYLSCFLSLHIHWKAFTETQPISTTIRYSNKPLLRTNHPHALRKPWRSLPWRRTFLSLEPPLHPSQRQQQQPQRQPQQQPPPPPSTPPTPTAATSTPTPSPPSPQTASSPPG